MYMYMHFVFYTRYEDMLWPFSLLLLLLKIFYLGRYVDDVVTLLAFSSSSFCYIYM